MSAITLKAVEKWFGKVQVIKGVDLKILEGELIVFVGPSGCGKSTLLRMIGGLEDISRGSLEINGKDVSNQPPFERGLSMVFQSYALYPHMTVRENMGFSLKTAGAPTAEINKKVSGAAETLKLAPFLNRKPKELSGGQRQRVAIGRSIVREPTAFLFDEPLSNLDAALRVEMRHEISTLHQSLKTTMIYVTHDQVEAMTLADRIVVLDAGRIVQVGTPKELYKKPANIFVAQFIGSPKMNVVSCKTKARAYTLEGGGGGAYGFSGKSSEATRIGIRPEHIVVGKVGKGTLNGIAMVIEYLGADTFILFNCGKVGNVLVRLAGETNLALNEKASLRFNDKHVHFFDSTGNAIR